MKLIDGHNIVSRVSTLFKQLNVAPPSLEKISFIQPDMDDYEKSLAEVLDENMRIAASEGRPLCQDCGVAQLFVRKGRHVDFTDGYTLTALLEEGVKQAYGEGFLRKSTVDSPFERNNPGTNLPAFIHFEECDGDELTIYGMVKGGGSENVSALTMLSPAAGREGVADFIIETIRSAGGKGCPPYFVGIGVGATFDTVAIEAKKSLLTQEVSDDQLKELIEEKAQSLDFGVLGFPGKHPIKDIFIRTAPTHIAMLPVAVSLNCHSYRCGKIEF
ncbi:fumarate hydratase [bacterium]|nr:fumarate hydratase [bacterium]